MDTFLIILVVILFLYFIFRKKRTTTSSNNYPTPQQTETISQPRNYLQEATGFIGAPAPLEELVKTNREEVIHNLLKALDRDVKVGSTMVRKAAAYALGQIGEPSIINALKGRLNIEQADGVREAIIASITAINLAPDGENHSQLERRKIIEAVYNGKKQAVL